MGLVDCFNLLTLDDRHWDVAISVMKFQLLNDSDDQIFLSAVLGREGGTLVLPFPRKDENDRPLLENSGPKDMEGKETSLA